MPLFKDCLYPGPAKYKIPCKFEVESQKYSMRAKSVSKYTDKRLRAQPGPGKYNLP